MMSRSIFKLSFWKSLALLQLFIKKEYCSIMEFSILQKNLFCKDKIIRGIVFGEVKTTSFFVTNFLKIGINSYNNFV